MLRGVPWPLAALAAALCALCVLGRTGLTFDPVAWFGAAVVALIADSNDRRAWYALVPFVFLWAMAENGATVALVITAAATAGAIADHRIEKRDIRGRVFTCLAIAVAALAQPHLSPLRGYGIHWLYLDALLAGAQRDRFLLLPPNFTGTGVFALAVLGAWYGLRRRARSADAFTFLVFFLLTLCDARNAPFFGIVAAPAVADAIASQGRETAAAFNLTRILEFSTGFAVCAMALVAAVAVAEPRATVLRPSAELPVGLLKHAASAHAHVILCERPRWCDDALHLRLLPVLDDRAGLSTIENRVAQARASHAHDGWSAAMAAAHVDAAIVSTREPLATLLSGSGWHEAGGDGGRLLFLRVRR